MCAFLNVVGNDALSAEFGDGRLDGTCRRDRLGADSVDVARSVGAEGRTTTAVEWGGDDCHLGVTGGASKHCRQ